ncbi:MAG: DNA-directed RNA polymerase subunit omega [Deltaproteobacteria bacterium]|nr:DNA-directed RNA polymerase subunit omega [Deltaproteobacteria bacterium]
MARITVEDCLGFVPNRFGLVMVAAKRVKQIMRGSRYLIPNSDDNREMVMALREIAAKKVHFVLPPETSRG